MKKLHTYFPVLLTMLCAAILAAGCKKMLEVKRDISLYPKATIFADNRSATAAVTAIYAEMLGENQGTNFASGKEGSLVALCGLSSDELSFGYETVFDIKHFEQNDLRATNPYVGTIWKSMFSFIYQTNSILEGLDQSDKLTDSVKAQLQGEAYFIRAFCHFYLTNVFGKAPIIITTDYKMNAVVSRREPAAVYEQVIADLEQARSLMSAHYPSAERVRPNKFAATALLARAYLYTEQWDKAAQMATAIINSGAYDLPLDLDQVFLNSSQEAIWQIMPTGVSTNTNEALTFILTAPPELSYPNSFSLTNALLHAFEPGDTRKTAWVNSADFNGDVFYYPFKYKVNTGSSSNPPAALTEYSMVLRLGEQYLIRAEAFVHLSKIDDAKLDVNRIRSRAGLLPITSMDQQVVLEAIAQERRIELFAEWGHRWFDLKRTGKVSETLSGLKAGWSIDDALYPIPDQEIMANPNLLPQNPGY